MKGIILTPPKSLVRYPRATIITLYALLIIFMATTKPEWWTIAATIPAIWLILDIDDREEQRKGFFKAYKQIIDQLGE